MIEKLECIGMRACFRKLTSSVCRVGYSDMAAEWNGQDVVAVIKVRTTV